MLASSSQPHMRVIPVDSVGAPILVVDNFLSGEVADEIRRDFEAHFSSAFASRSDTHQIWNYWFVPNLYAYLRTQPEKIIKRARVDQFMDALRRWSTDTLGMHKITWPYLSLYVCGCHQNLHNDSKNGRFGFVYSLTLDERRTVGGGTIILREGDLVRGNLHEPRAGMDFYQAVEPRFNRLIVFDDRLIHGVERVDGSMDPIEGRCVLHGHIEESGPIVVGTLTLETLREGICACVDRFVTEWSASVHLYQGPLILRYIISPDGIVVKMQVLLDRVMHESGTNVDWELLRSRLIFLLSEGIYPRTSGSTTVTLPVTFGGPLNPTGK